MQKRCPSQGSRFGFNLDADHSLWTVVLVEDLSLHSNLKHGWFTRKFANHSLNPLVRMNFPGFSLVLKGKARKVHTNQGVQMWFANFRVNQPCFRLECRERSSDFRNPRSLISRICKRRRKRISSEYCCARPRVFLNLWFACRSPFTKTTETTKTTKTTKTTQTATNKELSAGFAGNHGNHENDENPRESQGANHWFPKPRVEKYPI